MLDERGAVRYAQRRKTTDFFSEVTTVLPVLSHPARHMSAFWGPRGPLCDGAIARIPQKLQDRVIIPAETLGVTGESPELQTAPRSRRMALLDAPVTSEELDV